MELPHGRDGVWLDLVADLLESPLTAWPFAQVAQLLVETFDARACGYYARGATTPTEESHWPMEHFVPNRAAITEFTRQQAAIEHPILRYMLATGDVRCMQVVDVPPEIADRRIVDGWIERGKAWGGVQTQLSVPLLHARAERRSFVLGRPDTFTPQEMASIRRLQRLLLGLDRQIAAYARWVERSGAAKAETADAIGLTPRQLAVLDLLAHGHTAAAIGRRLGIAERTVQKHLQRVYAGLGVADRLSAVQRAQHIGLL